MKALEILKKAAPELELGATYKDNVSGWEGVLTAVYVYMNGCVRVSLDGKDDKGAPKGYSFDQEQIEFVQVPIVKTKKAQPSGGPRDNRPVAR